MAVTSLTLNQDTWDIQLDGNNDLAVFSGKARVAQDVATSIRLFKYEAYYALENGIPYQSDVFPIGAQEIIIRSHMKRQALAVPNVTGVLAINFESLAARKLTGTVIVDDDIVEAQ